MHVESGQYKRRSNCDVTVHGQSSLRVDRADGKVGGAVHFPEQVLWIKEEYEYH
jgi:hypothetical protein